MKATSPMKPLKFTEATLPAKHKSWKKFTKHLLSKMSKKKARLYITKFKTSLKFWHRKGGGLSEELIADLAKAGYPIKRNGKAIVGSKDRVTFRRIPDNTDNIKGSSCVPSWKRMCFCILQNDPYCTFMGFAMPKALQVEAAAKQTK